MRKLLPLLLILLALSPARLSAQKVHPADSIPAFRPSQLIAPGVLMGSGLAIHCLAHDTWDAAVRDRFQQWSAGKPDPTFDDYIQHIPVIVDLGLGFTGVRSEHCFIDRGIEAALAYASCGILSWTGKTLFNTLRPNGADYHSFPSGHCTTVFCGAELVRLEYGWGWGAGAYCIAATVAVMRMYRNWHWLSDVLAGAGVGILAADIGHWLLEPTKRLLGIDLPDNLQFGVAPTVDPLSGSLCATFAMKF